MENNKKYPYSIDVPVLLIFFNRPKCLKLVFSEVKKARPSKLFLYQDGARKGNEKDIEGIEACRNIVSDIDWECEVHKLYQNHNFGCDPSGYIARKWVFETIDKCIILEDDCVPSQSFFPFCKELLDKYENDTRINMICGMNNLNTWPSPHSYFYSDSGSIWGIATWKRVIDLWDAEYKLCDDEYSLGLLRNLYGNATTHRKNLEGYWKRHQADGKEYHESLGSICQLSQSMLNIVPTRNLIKNVGNSIEGGTHSVSSIKLIPHRLRKIFTMPKNEVEFPLKHPAYVIHDIEYGRKLHKLMGDGYPHIRIWRLIEKVFLILRYKGVKELISKYKGRKL